MAIDWGLAELLALLPAGVVTLGLVIVLVGSFLVSLSYPVEGCVKEKDNSGRASSRRISYCESIEIQVRVLPRSISIHNFLVDRR